MEARRYCTAVLAVAIGLIGLNNSFAASDRTTNFIVSAPSQELAREVAQMAEQYRRELAIEWIGRELPRWHEPCPINVKVGPHLGAGGATSFMFDRGRPFGWRMSIQGSRQRLLDSVLPHEITHTIFATYFGRPLPRWADEGACTSVEHNSEKSKQEQMLNQFLRSKPSRGIPFNRMFAMKEYPSDIMPLYSQGFSLVRFLLNQGGKQKFMRYLGDGMQYGNWDNVTKKHYGFRDLSELQLAWVDWVAAGSPDRPDRSQIASTAPVLPRDATLVAQVSNLNNDRPVGIDQGRPQTPTTRDTSRPQDLVLSRNIRDMAPQAVSLANDSRTEVIARGQSEDSWYARQRDKFRGKSVFSIGSTGNSRIAFSSFASLSDWTKSFPRSGRNQVEKDQAVYDLNDPVPPPPAAQQKVDELLERPLARPQERATYPRFYRHDKPLSAGGTVWR